ncbi:hypothetical protein CK203_097349 [Vitis vinifera]|uniref:Uncharacterized protein n=1 Tax=Vitis vinifera TaxID=29760 RepID=A0A438D670_VITVI|nr:hypothetical protein CK203_097349 [Vitis vinifera]
MGYANFEGVMRISHNTLWNAKFSHNLEQLASEAISSSFQLQIMYGLKRWILDFQRFEMVYNRASIDRVMREVHAEFMVHTWEDTCWARHRSMGSRAANKNIKKILRKMVETSRDWSKKLPLHCGILYLFRTFTRATPYSLVYGLSFEDSQRFDWRLRGKFRPSWSGPYVIRELTPEGTAWLTDLDGNQFSRPTNVDQLKKYYV